jgi:HTH-type transcriptional regulator, sugar sensing transcriptional regulator
MIVQQELLRKLKDFGLNSYESKLWTALLSRGISTAGELSDIAGVPRSRCYDVLESLEKKGFIITKLGKPIKYLAIEPNEVVERVKKRVHEEATQQITQLEKVEGSDVLEELNSLYHQGVDLVEPSDLTGSIKGRVNIHNHMDHAIKNAKKEVLLVTSAKGLVRKHEALKKSFKKAKERGVDIKVAAPLTPDNQAVIEDLKKYATFKAMDHVDGRFMVVDNEYVTFMLMDGEKVHANYDTAVWAKTPFFAQTVREMFKHAQDKK